MAEPSEGGVRKLKHLARYLIAHPEVELCYPWLHEEEMRPFTFSQIRIGRDAGGAARARAEA